MRRLAIAPSYLSQIEADKNTVARAKGTWKSYIKSEIILIYLI
jgi:hypothetical protein